MWFGAGAGFTHGPDSTTTQEGDNALTLAMPGDYNGDGHDDLLWWLFEFNDGPGQFSESTTYTLWHAN
jgi:hypothetical protein